MLREFKVDVPSLESVSLPGAFVHMKKPIVKSRVNVLCVRGRC